ncbi:DNA glycosylase AlkZ-like family protein [Nonomuraea coxensis]|uniref:DNA glycosylase AlkZ-like family protein n=1 Tax=Nonomuraea coxensis TaxID=404386 RepID=UPI0003736D2E|nr:crosslink repair DNA glycosylase YcaQ family protein [Nonomuraea coxensis]
MIDELRRVLPTVLIDGHVRGTWSFTAGEIRLTPFRPLPAAEQQAVDHEIGHLLPFLSHRPAHPPRSVSERRSHGAGQTTERR